MKAKFFAKRLTGGHVYLDTLDIPDGSLEWRIPVRQPVEVKISAETRMTPPNTMDAVRVFRYQHDPLGRALEALPRFLEV